MNVTNRSLSVGLLLALLNGCDSPVYQQSYSGSNLSDTSDNLKPRAVSVSGTWQAPELIYAKNFAALYPDKYLDITISDVGNGVLLSSWWESFPVNQQMFSAKNATQNTWDINNPQVNSNYWTRQVEQYPDKGYQISVLSSSEEVVLLKYDALAGWLPPVSLNRVNYPKFVTDSLGFVQASNGNSIVLLATQEAATKQVQYMTRIISPDGSMVTQLPFNPMLGANDPVFDLKFIALDSNRFLGVWRQGELGGMAYLGSAVFDTSSGWGSATKISSEDTYWSSKFILSQDVSSGAINVVVADSRTGNVQYLAFANQQWSVVNTERLTDQITMATNTQGDMALAWYVTQLDSVTNTVTMAVNSKTYTHGVGWGASSLLTTFAGEPDMSAPAVYVAASGQTQVGWFTPQTLEFARFHPQSGWSGAEVVTVMDNGFAPGRYLGITADQAGISHTLWHEYSANGRQVSTRLYTSASN